MENQKKIKLDWLIVISIKEFKKYLNLNLIKEISLISKLFRLKFSPKLFYCIKLKEDCKCIDGELVSFSNVQGLYELDNLTKSNRGEFQKDLRSDKILSSIKSDFGNITKFVSKLYLNDINRFGCYLFPILDNFIHLKTLSLNKCTIPYSSFVNLGILFPKLTSIVLYNLKLFKLSTDIYNSGDYIFPPNLESMRISKIIVNERKHIFGSSDLLLIESYREYSFTLTLPQVSIPSLKRLMILSGYENDCNIEGFLDFNPNLKSLKMKTLHLSKFHKYKSIKSLEISHVACFDFEGKYIIQENIKELTIFIKNEIYFKYIAKLCSLCPNLEKLHFAIPYDDIPQQSFDNFLIPVLSKLPKAKTLILRVYNDENYILDINEFPHIESLILEIKILDVLNIKFDSCLSLKSIEVKHNWLKPDDELLLEELSKIRSAHSNWVFKISKGKIMGYKNSNKLL